MASQSVNKRPRKKKKLPTHVSFSASAQNPFASTSMLPEPRKQPLEADTASKLSASSTAREREGPTAAQESSERPDPSRKGRALRRIRRSKSHAAHSNESFDGFEGAIADLVAPFLAATAGTLPDRATWTGLRSRCTTANAIGLERATPCDPDIFTVVIKVVDIESTEKVTLQCCARHILHDLVAAGLFPASPVRPQLAFSFSLLRLFRSLQDHARIGTSNFIHAIMQFIKGGTSRVKASPSVISEVSMGKAPDGETERSSKKEAEEANTSGASAGRHTTAVAGSSGMVPRAGAQESYAAACPIVDTNINTAPSIVTGSSWPQYTGSSFEVSSLEVAREEFEKATPSRGPRTGCTSQVKAAIDGAIKTSTRAFDVTGVVGMTCRHGAPLLMVDVTEAGEGHHYAFALIDALVKTCGSKLQSLGICYDISCKLAVSPRVTGSLAGHSVKFHYAVSLFHVYGHDYDCQLKFSPRRCKGFGLTDGESLERLWAALSNLVSLTRSMSAVHRRQSLSTRLERLCYRHRSFLIRLLSKRLARVLEMLPSTLKRLTQELYPEVAAILNEPIESPEPMVEEETGELNQAERFVLDQCDKVASQHELASDPADSGSRRLASFDAICVQDRKSALRRLQQLCMQRRRVAFARAAVNKADGQNRQDPTATNSSTPVPLRQTESEVEEALSAAAYHLYVPLSHWLALTEQLRRRDTANSNKTHTQFSKARNGSTAKIKNALPLFNSAVTQYISAVEISDKAGTSVGTVPEDGASGSAGPQAAHPIKRAALHTLPADKVYRVETALYLSALIKSHNFKEEPWILDPFLGPALDTFELLERLCEEKIRLIGEVSQCLIWYSEEALRLETLHQHPINAMMEDRKSALDIISASHENVGSMWANHLRQFDSMLDKKDFDLVRFARKLDAEREQRRAAMAIMQARTVQVGYANRPDDGGEQQLTDSDSDDSASDDEAFGRDIDRNSRVLNSDKIAARAKHRPWTTWDGDADEDSEGSHA
ncbi:hypothetical protein OC835_003018 [Tilletia horrida]|nr:hypothetical protein OC835_003018 [Tilletia horrida]